MTSSRIVRLALRLAASTVLVVALALLAGLAFLRTAGGQRFASERLAGVLREATGMEVAVASVRGDLVRVLAVEGLRLRHAGGTVVAVERLTIRWFPLALLRGRIHLDEVLLDGVALRLVRRADGRQLPSGETSSPPWPPALPSVVVDRLRLRDARLALGDFVEQQRRYVALTATTLDAALRLDPDGLHLDIRRLSAVPRGISLTAFSANATVSVDRTGAVMVPALLLETRRSRLAAHVHIEVGKAIRGEVRCDPLDRHELAAFVPALTLERSPRVAAAFAGPWDSVRLRVDAHVDDQGSAVLAAALDLGDPGLRWGGRLAFAALDPRVADPALPPARLDGTLVASGRRVASQPRVVYRLVLAPSTLAGRHIEALRISGGLRGAKHRARLTATIDSSSLRLSARAMSTARAPWRASGRLHSPDVAALVPAVPGTLGIALRGRGQGMAPAERQARVRFTVGPASLFGVAFDRGGATLALDGSAIRLSSCRLLGPDTILEAEAAGDLRDASLRARLRASTNLRVLAQWLSLEADGRARLDAELDGTLDALAARATLRAQALRISRAAAWDAAFDLWWTRTRGIDTARLALRATAARDGLLQGELRARHDAAGTTVELAQLAVVPPGLSRWDLVSPATVTIAPSGAVRVPDITAAAHGQRITLRGQLEPAGPVDVTVALQELALAELCPTIAAFSCAGRLSAEARLRGTAAAPTAQLHLEIADLAVAEHRFGIVSADARYSDLRLALEAHLDYLSAGRLTLDGVVPIDLRWGGPATDLRSALWLLQLRAEAFDLGFLPALSPGVVRELDGRLSADLRLSGPRHRLQPAGTVDLQARRVLLVAIGVPFEDVTIRLRGDAAGVELSDLSLRGGDGLLRGRGRLALEAGRPGKLQGQLEFSDFLAVRLPAYEASLEGVLDIGGTADRPSLVGALDVVRAIVRPGLLPGEVAAAAVDPTIEILGHAPGTPGEPASGVESPIARIAATVDVRLARNAWIRLPDAQIELAGDLRIVKPAFEDARVSGAIRLVRGWYAFQGRRFTIAEGVFVFAGESPPDPAIDLRATHRAGAYTVTVQITGTAARPTLQLTADPPLEQADILAVLLFGRPAHELGQTEGLDLQRQALSLASSYVIPELQTSVMDTLGLDLFELSGESIRAGRYVTRDVFISIAQQFGTIPAQSVAVEYGLTRRLSLRASTSTTGQSAIDLEWHHRY